MIPSRLPQLQASALQKVVRLHLVVPLEEMEAEKDRLPPSSPKLVRDFQRSTVWEDELRFQPSPSILRPLQMTIGLHHSTRRAKINCLDCRSQFLATSSSAILMMSKALKFWVRWWRNQFLRKASRYVLFCLI